MEMLRMIRNLILGEIYKMIKLMIFIRTPLKRKIVAVNSLMVNAFVLMLKANSPPMKWYNKRTTPLKKSLKMN